MSFNWIDLIIILAATISVLVGLRVGLIRLILIIATIFGTLFLSSYLVPRMLWFIDNPTTQSVLTGNVVLGLTLVAPFYADRLGRRLRHKLKSTTGRQLEAALSVFVSISAVLVLAWLLAAALSRLPFEGLSNSVSDSWIVRSMDRRLPATPVIFARFGRLIDPNVPRSITFEAAFNDERLPRMPEVDRADQIAGGSSVRVTGFGCGGIVSGSGFVVAPNLVMTNAHVVAGIERPILKLKDRSFSADAVYFNANLDIAILRTRELAAPPLTLVDNYAAGGSTIAILGYTEGNYQVIPGNLGDAFTIVGTSIYDIGSIKREVYLLSALVSEGNSGAPVVLESGQVIGMVFAKVENKRDAALALTSKSLIGYVEQAKNTSGTVGTGYCTK